jgi:hypothetical protein
MKARDLRQMAKRAGWMVSVTNGGHLRLEHPQASGPVIASATSSDRRALYNTRADMRRALPKRTKAERGR